MYIYIVLQIFKQKVFFVYEFVELNYGIRNAQDTQSI